MKVLIGAHDLKANDFESIPVMEFHRHPDWGNITNPKNDIMLLKVIDLSQLPFVCIYKIIYHHCPYLATDHCAIVTKGAVLVTGRCVVELSSM